MSWMFEKLKQWTIPKGMLPLFRTAYALAFVAILVCGFYVLYNYWPDKTTGASKLKDVIEAYRNIGLFLAGFLALFFAWLRLQKMDQQILDAKTETNGKESERVRASFQQAVAMLYGEEDATKPFAITQIRRIALDKPDQHLEQAISLLCGFVRKNSPRPEIPAEGEESSTKEDRDYEFLQACLNIIFELAPIFEKLKNRPIPIDLRKTYLGKRTITGITLTSDAIDGIWFDEIEFLNCTFIGKFSRYIMKEAEFHRGLEYSSSFSAKYINSKFVNATFDGLSFQGATFTKCTSECSAWKDCNLSASTFDALKIIGNYVQTDFPDGRSELFENCDMGNASFTFSEAAASPSSGSGKGARYSYRASDFSQCYVRPEDWRVSEFDVSCLPPIGLDDNTPALMVKVDEPIYMSKTLITVKNANHSD